MPIATRTDSLDRSPSETYRTAEWFPLRWQLGSDESWPAGGLHGVRPLPWWSAGWYAGGLRERVLSLRRQPDCQLLQGPISSLRQALTTTPIIPASSQLVLVPLPGWRRKGNRIPALLAQALVEVLEQQPTGDRRWLLEPELLQRNCRVSCQHRLNRQQRWRNQWLSFRARLPGATLPPTERTVLLVDDVLTSGATALEARRALQAAGWHVAGLLCLARTPRHRVI